MCKLRKKHGNPADSHAIKSGSPPKSVGAASVPYIDVQTGVKYGNLADNQVEKSGHPPAILGFRMPTYFIHWTGV